MMVLTGICGGCDRRWLGLTLAHCPHCHKTFGSVSLFDFHRKDGVCKRDLVLALQGVTEVRPGVWGRSAADRRSVVAQQGVPEVSGDD